MTNMRYASAQDEKDQDDRLKHCKHCRWLKDNHYSRFVFCVLSFYQFSYPVPEGKVDNDMGILCQVQNLTF